MQRALFGLLVVVAFMASYARAENLPAVHLKVVGGLGNTSQFRNFEQPFWTKRLAERSNGRITAEVTPFDQLGLRGSELLQLTRLGAITIGTTSLSQIASEDPEAAAIDLAGLNWDIETLRSSIDAYRETLAQMYRHRYGVELLAIWTYPAQIIFCNRSIKHLEDLRGLRVRAASAMHLDFVEAIGGTGVVLPFEALPDAFRNGVIDCAITAAMSGYRLGLHKLTTHVDALTVSWGPNIVVANLAAWHRLDPAVSSFLTKQLADLTDEIWATAERETSQGLDCVTGRAPCPAGPPGNLTLVPVAEEDKRQLREALSQVVLPHWADRCGEECVLGWNQTVGRQMGLTATAGP